LDYSDSSSLDNKELYKVEQIVDYKIFYLDGNKEYKYKVYWAGYRPENNKWICPELFNSLKIIKEYY
jgi:hypothetical protein